MAKAQSSLPLEPANTHPYRLTDCGGAMALSCGPHHLGTISKDYGGTTKNAEEILRRLDAHDDLVEALSSLVSRADALLGCLNPVNLSGLKEQNYLALLDDVRHARERLNAAVAHG